MSAAYSTCTCGKCLQCKGKSMPWEENRIVPNDITNARRRDEYIDGLLGLLDESHAFVNKFVAEVHKGRTQFNMLFLEAKALARKIETMKKGKDGTT